MGGLSKVLKVITKRPKKSVMKEAQEGAKRAERGSKVKQVEKRVLPKVKKVRKTVESMRKSPTPMHKRAVEAAKKGRKTYPGFEGEPTSTAAGIKNMHQALKHWNAVALAEKFTAKELVAMRRKIADPKMKKELNAAIEQRRHIQGVKQGQKRWESWEKRGESEKTDKEFKAFLEKAKKAARWKSKGGTVKRKSGGKMNTDGNAYVASLYKGGKVGG